MTFFPPEAARSKKSVPRSSQFRAMSGRASSAILLPMQQDPLEEWRRLTTLYGQMGDIEIRELAGQINDLVPNAQQILRDEMKKRSISTDQPISRAQASLDQSGAVPSYQEEDTDACLNGEDSGDGEARDYTWKVALCRCESLNEAAARSEMLRKAGVDSWIQRPGSRFVIPWIEVGVGDIQINVAADQLEHAKAIAAQPIPQDILDQLAEEDAAPADELPTCPHCHAADPTLESVEPSNSWLCESCGHTWSDPIPQSTEG